MSYPDAALSSKGATIVPASGSTPASVMARVAREKTSVPAGTFDAIQVKHQIGDRMPTLTWYGPGLGYWGLRETRTSTLSIDGGGVSTVSTDAILKTYTP